MPLQFPDIPEHVRGWIYRVLAAVSLVVVFYGIAEEAEVALWLGVAASLLGNGLATANTSRHAPDAGQSVLVVALVAAAVCFVLLLLLDVIHVQ